MDNAAQALPLVQQLEGVIDMREREVVGDVLVDFDLLQRQ